MKDIHTLLTASVMDYHMEDDGPKTQIDDHMGLLTKRLMGKNTKSLQFVATNLCSQPLSEGQIFRQNWVNVLVEWIKSLSSIVASCRLIIN